MDQARPDAYAFDILTFQAHHPWVVSRSVQSRTDKLISDQSNMAALYIDYWSMMSLIESKMAHRAAILDWSEINKCEFIGSRDLDWTDHDTTTV